VGRYFATFGEAWSFFLTREEPLEDFFDELPDHDSYVLCWLLAFDEALVARIRTAQSSFAELEWITPQPVHFLHTSIAAVRRLAAAALASGDRLRYRASKARVVRRAAVRSALPTRQLLP
jgi:hypothetical protein